MEEIAVVYEDDFMRVERIVSNGAVSPADFWYDQDEEEYVLVTCGAARLRTPSGVVSLCSGQSILLPAHCKHRVEYTSPDCQWSCVFIKNKV